MSDYVASKNANTHIYYYHALLLHATPHPHYHILKIPASRRCYIHRLHENTYIIHIPISTASFHKNVINIIY